MKRAFCCCWLLLGLAVSSAWGQQVPHFTQYMHQGTLLNPAWLNRPEHGEAAAYYRRQWSGAAGLPESRGASLLLPFGRERWAWGATVLDQSAGLTRQTWANGSLAHRLRVGPGGVLALGLSAGMVQYRLDRERLLAQDDPRQDPALQVGDALAPDWGAGLLLRNREWSVGLSARHLPAGRRGRGPDWRPHFFGMLAYSWGFAPRWSLEPSLLAKKAVGAPLQTDWGVRLLWAGRFWAGCGLRPADAVTWGSGVVLPSKNGVLRYRVGYAYDLTTSGLNAFSRGSHELMVSVSFFRGERVKCPEDKLPFDLDTVY